MAIEVGHLDRDPIFKTHLAFHVQDLTPLECARDRMRALDVSLEDQGDEIGPVAPGSVSLGASGFTIPMSIAGSSSSKSLSVPNRLSQSMSVNLRCRTIDF